MCRNRTRIATLVLVLTSSCPALAAEDADSFKAAPLAQLLVHVQREGTTERKRENKKLAREEIFARREQSLKYLINHAHIRNMWIQILTEQLVNRLEAEEAVPVLLSYLDSEHDRTRKIAAYYLGFFDVPDHAGSVLPLLEDEEAAGATVRTLGKWKIQKAVPLILPFLNDEKERRRVIAANALGEIGDPAAVPALIEALEDPYFTVRKCAARALTAIGETARPPLEAAAPAVGTTARREIESVLSTLGRQAETPVE